MYPVLLGLQKGSACSVVHMKHVPPETFDLLLLHWLLMHEVYIPVPTAWEFSPSVYCVSGNIQTCLSCFQQRMRVGCVSSRDILLLLDELLLVTECSPLSVELVSLQ